MTRCIWCVGLAAAVVALVSMSGRPCQAQATKAKADEGHLKFEIFKDGSDEFRWRLKAGNGEVLATGGQGYKAKADAKNGVERIKSDVGKLTFEDYEDNAKEHRWRLKAANGQVIGTSSQGYKSKADADKAVELIKKGAAKAEVDDKS